MKQSQARWQCSRLIWRMLWAVAASLFECTTASAHPAWAPIEDNAGNVYFSSVAAVWKITPDDRVLKLVDGIHTHEIGFDRLGCLRGEHLDYRPDARVQWRHRMWRLRADGTIEDEAPLRDGFLEDDGFAADAAHNHYFVAQDRRGPIKVRKPDGRVEVHASGLFTAIGKMVAAANGTLWLTDAGQLKRVHPGGQITTVVARLSANGASAAQVAAPHYHMGVWLDHQQNVWVATPGERLVLKVDANRQLHVVDRSTPPWLPTGGLVDRRGRLWILETTHQNQTRMRRVNGTQSRIFTLPE